MQADAGEQWPASAETADNVYEFATDTFIVRDGMIAAQSFAGKIAPRH
ncbi:MAG: hypothetical protein AMXMBFR72_06950 [Betaproteobacteria bacterium]|jgi:hypothetical protein|nr:MAG: hypothetical protein BroJett031_15930 [Betaproteobacteria bacterium]